MFWADKIAKDIISTGKYKPYWVDDMFTPSGHAHIGSLRGPIVHDITYRALHDAKQKVTLTYVFNDFDPIDGLPPELTEKFSKYFGFSLRLVPSPKPGFDSFADYFTKDFQNVLRSLGVGAEFVSSWDLYHEGRFNEVIRIALDSAEKIQDIYQRVSGSKKREKGWLPLQVVCDKCGKLGTTRVHDWDGNTVTYTCEPTMVTWAAGCGFTGKTSPFADPDNPKHHPGKLPWKVDWPAHWKVLGVTIEGAGKDHTSAGGSRDIARALCEEVFNIPDPYNLPYEFFLIGGKKMSSSKGLGLKARDLTKLLPPTIGRFLFTRTDYRQTIEFNPVDTMAIPDLFDEYDRCWRAYNDESDENLSRAFELSQISEAPKKKKMFIPRFRDIANFYQLPNVNLDQRFAEIKGEELTDEETKILYNRLTDANVWVANYAPEDYKYQISLKKLDEINLSQNQWDFLNDLSVVWQQTDDPERLQTEIFKLSKSKNMDSKEAFGILYKVLLDKSHGPRAGWLLKKFPKDTVIERLTLNKHASKKNVAHFSTVSSIKAIQKSEYFMIDSTIKEKYPSITIGIAFIRGVSVVKKNQDLEQEKQKLLDSLKGLTTEQLGQFPEIISYRKLYKETGIDWHSRRPSPEALLRRVVLGKGLYTINTCVDAYNLIVMKHRVSAGAFDADEIGFPTVLRFAKSGESIHLLGDEEPTQYKEGEIAYFDKTGGFNIDFNYRDAKRTAVGETTKNLWINVDGVYDVTPELVQRTLRETIAIIQKYCGGTVEFEGVVI